MYRRSWLAHALIWGLVLMVGLWCLVVMTSADRASLAALLGYAGRVAGILGLLMLLLAGVLSARIPGVDRYFGGLTKLWKTHHLLGAGSLLALMLHPWLLALESASISVDAATASLLPSFTHWPIWAGWASLLLMMVFLAPSFHFFGRPDYSRWKILHALAGPAIILALLHAWQFGRVLPPQAQRLLWGVLAILAVGAVAWRLVFSRRIGRLRYQVDGVVAVANNLVELTLSPVGRRQLRYEAGQFVYLTPYDPALSAGYGEEHPYTLSSAPHESGLRIAIKALGDASHAIQTIAPGSRVDIEGPYGRFFPPTLTGPEVWIAGGIGITPFLARARHLLQQGRAVDVCLVYCVQDEARARFADELQLIAEQLGGFQFIPHYFYRYGPLDGEFLAEHCPDLSARTAFICGPASLDHLARQVLASAGVSRSAIHTEEFELV